MNSVLASQKLSGLSLDDWFVITITDANFARYGISEEELHRVMTRQPKVHTALICIGQGAEALWYACNICAEIFAHVRPIVGFQSDCREGASELPIQRTFRSF